MNKIEMAKAYSSSFDPQYREVAYDAFLCGYDAKCDAPSSKEPVCLYDGGAPSKQKCGDCTVACSVRVEEEPNKSLEKAAEEYATMHFRNNEFPTAVSAFIAGAKWDREQMMKGAIVGEVILSHGQKVIEHRSSGGIQESSFPNMSRFSVGDKVFIIITK